MITVHVDPRLQDNYDEYYPELSEWRELGAADKASRVFALPRPRAPASVVGRN